MNHVDLDAAIELANRVFNRGYVQDFPRKCTLDKPTGAPEGQTTAATVDDWQLECRQAEKPSAQPHAKLLPLLGRKVRTPAGPGTLLQVFLDRATVLLDSELSKCSCFSPRSSHSRMWK
jgi:hypothetical protein